MKIAVVGCGLAGSTVASQLADTGHDVALFEQAEKCGPVGAGILLQPSGQRVLQRLGLLDEVVARSAGIDALHAQHRTGEELVHLDYKKLDHQLFGLGVLRGLLFELLLQRCRDAGVGIHEGQQVVAYTQTDGKVRPTDATGKSIGEFDLLIAADGSRSRLRQASGLTKSICEYHEAALWMIGPCQPERRLLQLVDTDGRLVGILPVSADHCSFFWGLRKDEKDSVWTNGLDSWKRQVRDFYPAAEPILEGVHSFDDITFATYRNVRMKHVVDGRVVFIGDAAHATSPHLGQGANLALVDAVILADQLDHGRDYQLALQQYASLRKSTTRFYSQLTGMLTPFFQTQNRLLQIGRNLALPLMPKLPLIGRQMVLTMAGLKAGWFRFHDEERNLNPPPNRKN